MLVTADFVKVLYPAKDNARDGELDVCLDAASRLFEGSTGRRIEKAVFVERFNGDDADGTCGTILRLRRGLGPVLESPLPAVVENGISLTAAFGFSSSADVVVEQPLNALIPAAARMVRKSPWSPGTQNITVTYTAGYEADAIPSEVRRACAWFAWEMYRDPARQSVQATSAKGKASSFVKSAPSWVADVLNAWTVR